MLKQDARCQDQVSPVWQRFSVAVYRQGIVADEKKKNLPYRGDLQTAFSGNQFTLGNGGATVQEDLLAKIGIVMWLYGWVLIWPASRWVLRRSERECRVLFWIFVVAIGLEVASFIYLWSLYHAGNRDWFMAWMFPQAVATIAWIASLLTLLNMLLTPTPKTSSTHEPAPPVT